MTYNPATMKRLNDWQTSLSDLVDVLDEKPGSRSLEELRSSYIAMLEEHPLPRGVVVSEIVMGSLPGRRVVPVGIVPKHAIIYFHGGAYIIGGSAGYAALAGRLALATGAAVYIPDYRLAPEHQYPVPIQDCLEAYRWLLDQGFNANDVAFAGDSAGGALTVSVMTMARDAGVPLPSAGFAISPWVELEHHGASMTTKHGVDPLCTRDALDVQARTFLGDAPANSPQASPIYADVNGLPPILIHIGESEVMLSGAIQLAAHLGENRVQTSLEIWPEMFHVWHLFAAVLPQAEAAIQSAADFITASWYNRDHTPESTATV